MKKPFHHTFGQGDYEIIKREILYQGIFCLVRLHIRHRLFDGQWSSIFTREILERPPAAAVLPYDPHLDRVILIEQFRPGAIADDLSPWQLEIPAGMLNQHEKPLEVAIREALEETGCIISDLQLIQDYFVSPGGSNEYIHIYMGQVDAQNTIGIHGLTEEHENIRVHNLSTKDAFTLLHNHTIKNAPAILALQWLEQNLAQ